MIEQRPHSLYTFGTLNLYFPFPNPLTTSIKSAFFSFVIRLPAAVTESLVIAAMSDVIYRGWFTPPKTTS